MFLSTLSFLAFAAAISNIRQVDFRNFVYLVNGQEVPVRAGTGRVPSAEDPVIPIEVTHIDVTYGDLLGDREEEAAVVLGIREGGTGYFTVGHIYRLHKGKVQFVASFTGGDRANGGIVAVHIAHRLLSVARNHSSTDAITVDAVVTTTYALEDGRLVRKSERNRRVP